MGEVASGEDILRRIHAAGENYGRSDAGGGAAVQVEFVSANPTGPLTLVHGRSAALGDAIAGLLEWTGHRVAREFYVNDADGQISRLGRSVAAHYLRLTGRPTSFPEDGYPEDYVEELAAAIHAAEGDRYVGLPEEQRLPHLARAAQERLLAGQRATLGRFGVRFDCWYSERAMHASGKIETAVEQLRADSQVYEAEGALWLRTTAFGDEKDRTLVRGNGLPTYIAADIAYHLDKRARGIELANDVWGPDHAEYVTRTRASLRAVGLPPDWLEVRIFQPVGLRVDGLQVEGTSRKRLQEVLDEIGPQRARFFYLLRPADEPLELDLDLAKRESEANPWHWIRTALKRCGEAREGPETTTGLSPTGYALLEWLAEFPAAVRTAAAAREPYGMIRYALETARRYLEWDQEGPGSGASAERAAPSSLARASRTVLRNALAIVGVSAPEPD